ncbi:glycerate kinase, partial [Isoptericola sp. NPDC057559]
MHEDVKNTAPAPAPAPDGRPDRPPRVVVAPDSFKGSATATQVAEALAAGARAALGEAAQVRAVPFADGGE